jgi:hypothetical protein
MGKEQGLSAQKGILVSDAGYRFAISPNPFDVVSIQMERGRTPVQSFLTLLPAHTDSTVVTWKANVQKGRGPLARVQQYIEARRVQTAMARVLDRFKRFTNSAKNIYGLAVIPERVTDTLLVVTRLRDTVKPTMETYYGLIKKLRAYVAAQGAQEVNYPMLNVLETGTDQYETMVAIPINKVVPERGGVLFRRMVPGNILVAEVKGGQAAVDEGFRQLELFVSEHSLRSPGMPFQSLVTDRLAEKDTSRWITKMYYPIM